MFYEGDLQSGIADAIKQAKFVACFVRDDNEESALWENDYLKDISLGSLILERSLLLRLQAGSQEAAFLAAIYPVPKTPTLVIIHNGQLKEYLAAGTTKFDFLKRIKGALDDTSGISTSPTTENISTPSSEHENSQNRAQASSLATPRTENEQPYSVREHLSEQNTRPERENNQQEDAEKAERPAKAAASKETPEAAGIVNPKKAADIKYALMQKKRQQDARIERDRILKRVEDDKAERRLKETLRKKQAQATIEHSNVGSLESTEVISDGLQPLSQKHSVECAIQVRLFDGTTIRSRFPAQNTLRKEVRPWVDSQHTQRDVPYTFKQILIPELNKTITTSEEEESLHALGLAPSATLIVVPVKDYTSAYENGNGSYISRGVSTGVSLVASGFSLLSGTLGSLFGGVAAVGSAAEHGTTPRSTTLNNVNVRTFEDHRTSADEHQLYNGNTLNFEPRRDNNDSKED